MKKEEAVVFNHKLRNSAEACGLDSDAIDEKYAALITEINKTKSAKPSKIAESLEQVLTPRELSYILTMKLIVEAQEEGPVDRLLRFMKEE